LIFILFLKGLLNAQQQSVYVPSYPQTFDYSNTDETPLSIQQQEDVNSSSNDTLDFHSSTLNNSKIITEFLSTTDGRIPPQNRTYSSLSTENEYNNFDYREPTPPHEQLNKTTDTSFFIHNSTTATKLNVDWSNQTHVLRKTLANNRQYDIYNTTFEEAARYLTDRRLMQSLIHLLPPNIWSQIQKNQTIIQQDQSQYVKPLLPNPVVLAEEAAQAGLPGPGPYPVPAHLWPRNPPQFMTSISTTPALPLIKTTTTTLRPRPFIPIKPVTSPPSNNNNKHSLFSQIGFICPLGANNIRYPDRRLCNMYFTCTSSGLPKPNLCPEGYLFSDVSRDCELGARVNCGTRLSAFFEVEETKFISTTTSATQSKLNPNNSTIDCILGSDGYYEDPLYCNVYHHCIAGVDYIEPCPNQLAWNEKKKMCDWYVI
jgi:hypothetical protein